MTVQMKHNSTFDSGVHVKMTFQGDMSVEHQYDDTDQENTVRYVPTRREVDSLVINNYLFQRVSASTNKDGSVGWRCKEYRTKYKCQSTCRISSDGQIIRRPGPHNHERESDAGLAFMQAKRNAKLRCRSDNNLPVEKIFLQEIGKAIINNGIQLTQEDIKKLPRFDANKRCLQIQRKIGIEQSQFGNNTSYTSDDNSESVYLDTITDVLKKIIPSQKPRRKRDRAGSVVDQLSTASSDENSIKDEQCDEQANTCGDVPEVKEIKKRKLMNPIKTDNIGNSESLKADITNNSQNIPRQGRKRAKTLNSIDQISLNIQKNLLETATSTNVDNEPTKKDKTPRKSDRSSSKFCDVNVSTPVRKKKNRINNLASNLWNLKYDKV